MEITFDAADPPALASFWSEFAADEIELTFVWSDAPKIEKNRVHLDLASSSLEEQADIVARALKLGAERADIGQGDVPWVVMRDPQGNEFCVLEPRPEYTGAIAAVVVDARDPMAAALATGHPVVRSGDGWASVRPEPGPWLEFVQTDDADPITNRVRLSWAGPSANEYDTFAAAYTDSNETDIQNAYYERPAMLALAGDVAGRRILDAGCGSGPLFAALRDRGAVVSGVDMSAGMLELARQRLGDDADLRVADLADPLPFDDDTFDDVVASLVLHYLENWGPTLTELRRVLKPGGRLLISVDHPFAIHAIQRHAGERTDYFATYNWTEEWEMDGQQVQMSFWNRPLHAMTDAFTSAGFQIATISEPLPVPAARELFPDDYRALTTSPSFLFFVLN